MREKIKEILKRTLEKCSKEGLLPKGDFDYLVERPKVEAHGDYSANLAFAMAKAAKDKPYTIAQTIVDNLADDKNMIKSASIAGGGFINFILNDSVWQNSLKEIEELGAKWTQFSGHKNKKVNVEFISANPTGPLHIGNARGGPLGDVIASLLELDGAKITREYLINDVGGQVLKLGESILSECQRINNLTLSFKEQQYTGEYVKEIAEKALQDCSDLDFANAKSAVQLSDYGIKTLVGRVRSDVANMGIKFDDWVPEGELLRGFDQKQGKTYKVIENLRKAGVVQKKDGAEWFVPPGASDDEPKEDRESVLVRSSGEPTYFANDIAYHVDKFERGADRLVDIWGSNHHGHIPRLRSALVALGYKDEQFQVILYQYVRVKRGEDAVKMSKRAGDFVLAREVLDEVGKDSFRFFLLYRAASSHLDFDLDLAKKQSSENPVFYVQYAHARICGILRKAEEQGIAIDFKKVDLSKINLPEEIGLIRALHDYPFEIQAALNHLEPHRIPYYLIELAKRLQVYYSRSKGDSRYHVLSQEIDTAQAKLYLLTRISKVLADGLKLLGISAPSKMESPIEEGEDA